MSVELDPPELGFRRPFQQEVSQTLRLHNPHSDSVAFKVKTTAPKQYCVRPNSGRIEPGEQVEIKILLQAMKEDPPADTRCRDKFLVQSVLIPADKEFDNVASLWARIERTSKQSIQEKKIRVNFLPADQSQSPAMHNAASYNEDSMISSPSPEAVTPHRPAEASTGSVSARKESFPDDTKDAQSTTSQAASAVSGIKSAVGSVAAGVASAVPTSGADLQAQLDEAKATIEKYRQQAVESTGLRQRKPEPSSEAASQLATAERVQAPAGGVSVPTVAVLCLVSFLLAYFLF
ncbi:VAMP-associated protein [Sporormia fimetaria CBS 119925]|uniref:VAMP-associated protein n=1 Tax=Sporormia fimetaria CBS 119925 TaxID=1340428 RepID=A0A6A6UY40_9PLEO|nr:VAMP-associated protein [Sporormia fimetaria CBS 119925]